MDILIVEDNPYEVKVLIASLELIMEEMNETFLIESVGTLKEAQNFLRDNPVKPDLIFLDLKLPDSPGWTQTYEAVAPYAPKIPVIVVSGYDDYDAIHEILKGGAEDYIIKGSRKRNIDTLKEAMEFALSRHKKVREMAEAVEQERQCVKWLSGSYSVDKDSDFSP